MTPTMKSLGIDQLPRDVQVALVQEIWDNIAAEGNALPLGESQRKELERRAAEDDADPNGGIPWECVEAETLARMRK